VRLAHRAKELDELPHNLSNMPSIQKVKNWYAQSFEVRQHNQFLGRIVCFNQNRSYHTLQELINFPPISLPQDIRIALNHGDIALPVSTPNPSIKEGTYSRGRDCNGFTSPGRLRIPIEKRYGDISPSY
jgi:pyruvate dehydrogenase kinase 2/3/4